MCENSKASMMLTPEQLAEWRDYVRTAKDTLVPMTKYELCSVLNHIDAQQARIAELEQDAARYRWIDPNDKAHEQYLPWIGETVLFCHGGVTYYGQHTGGSFQTGHGVTARNFNTWECRWMYPPAAMQK